MGLMILALGLGSLFVMPLSGALIARIGTLPVLRATSVVCGLVILPVALAPNVGVLVAALFVFGGIIGSMDIAMNSNAVVVERRLDGHFRAGDCGLRDISCSGSGLFQPSCT